MLQVAGRLVRAGFKHSRRQLERIPWFDLELSFANRLQTNLWVWPVLLLDVHFCGTHINRVMTQKNHEKAFYFKVV